MIGDAARADVPYQVMIIVLNHGTDHNDAAIIDLIPHPRYIKVTHENSENILQKLKLVLERKSSKKQKIKERAQEYLSLWNDPCWATGNFNCLNCPIWHKLREQLTMQEIEEMEENKQFLIDAIKLIEHYEKLEIQEKEDQILPF